LYTWLQLVKLVLVALGHRARYDEGGTGFVYQYTVHLVHYGVVVFSLHQVVGVGHHVVAQVVKPELVVRTVGYIGQVGGAALVAVGLVLVYTVYTYAMK